jgi:hypothetical protein
MGACKAELPDLVDEDAGVDLPCSVYADQLVAYNPAGGEGGSDVGSKALAAPDGDGVPLQANAVLTVAFIGLGGIVDATDDDIRVHGSVDGEVAVYLGESGTADLVFAGSLTSSDLDIDIEDQDGSLRVATYVQLVGISGTATIDAVEALQTSCNN